MAIPFHDGAVRYLKEIGAWNDEDQAHNDALVKRAQILAQAFEETLTASTEEGIKAAGFKEFWTARREEALKNAGLN